MKDKPVLKSHTHVEVDVKQEVKMGSGEKDCKKKDGEKKDGKKLDNPSSPKFQFSAERKKLENEKVECKCCF